MEQQPFRYFDIDEMMEAQGFTAAEIRKGEKLAARSDTKISSLSVGHYQDQEEVVCEAGWSIYDGSHPYSCKVAFSSHKLLRTACTCSSCQRSRYSWYYEYDYSSDKHCGYLAGLLLKVRDELDRNPQGDSTNWDTKYLLDRMSRQRISRLTARVMEQDQQVSLEPILRLAQGDLTLTFRIVEKKALLIRDLFEFMEHVDKGETALYGSKTQISHKLDNFDEKSRAWIAFIREVLQEEERTRLRMERQAQKIDAYYRAKKYAALDLYGWRLDRYYAMLGDGLPYEYTQEYPDGGTKKIRTTITRGEGDPQISLHIAPDLRGKRQAFYGVRAQFHFPTLYYGTEQLYYIEKERLCRTDRARLEGMETLLKEAQDGQLTLVIGREHLSEFYYSLLAQLGDVVTVTEENAALIQQYLPADVSFRFYLDVEDGDVTCSPYAIYEGQREVSLLDDLKTAARPSWRMPDREREVLYPLLSMFPAMDRENGFLSTGGSEDAVYDFLESGVAQLEELGEVHATNRFLNLNVIRRVKVSVGVAIESDLLNLEIATQDMTPQELLDVLHSYKSRKKYYRLRSGSFLNMSDPTLGMLEEMVTTLQITDKEFLKGNIHLPVYRTLYLNRLLEENENVYNTRDARFRSMVKNFKTVQEADFEPPPSLKETLRGYQVTGYKWLRTIESCGFGGILADEMGLGKTLQTIAVLLSHRLERDQITSPGTSVPAGIPAAEPSATISAPRKRRGRPPKSPSASMQPAIADAGRIASAPAASEAQVKSEAGANTSIVICPASLVYNWCEEFARFAPALKVVAVTGTQTERRGKIAAWQQADVLVTSYDLLKRDIAEYEGKTFDYEVIDEAQYIKNHTTAAAKAVKVIHASHRLALTGTPVENRLSELWSIFDFLMPGFLFRYDVFRREIETPIVKNQDEDAMRHLQKLTGPFILRRLKSDVLRDLPDKLEENRYVRMEGEQRRLYDAQVIQMQSMLSEQSDEEFRKSRIKILAELVKLRQLCCDPSLCVEPYTGGSAKLEGCLQLIQSAVDGGHRVLLFSQFVSMLEILQERLQQEGLEYYCITGATPKEQRLQMVKAFNADNVPVFLVSLKAGGVGLNLTGADVVIHYDPWWNLAVQNQATDRAHRIGQTRTVTVYKLITSQSIEEKIVKLQETKKDLADQILSGTDAGLTGMSRDDLMELLQA